MNSDDVAVSEAASTASGGGGAGAGGQADARIVDAIAAQLVRGALPGEVVEFSDADREEAARFIAGCAAIRGAGVALFAWKRLAERSASGGCGSASSMTTCRSWSIPSPMRSPRAG